MSLCRWFAVGLLLVSPLATLASGNGPASAVPVKNQASVSSNFSVSKDTQIPGRTLKPGAYTITVVDHLSDRMVVRVDKNGKMESTFLALPTSNLSGSGAISLIAGDSGKAALRGFVFANGTVAEFVYPKGEAVGLAKANGTKIPAIDPASQGMADNPALSKTDREMVTLWMLSPTPVGPNDPGPGVKAERYKEEASATVPPRPKPRQKPVIAVLPHTAGTMPLIVLLGFFSLAGAAWMTQRRMARV